MTDHDLLDFLSTQLNESQHEAVIHDKGPLLIIAGAGSGKTRVITARIAYLLQQSIPASSILALTFTNRAAGEMKERVAKFLPQGTPLPFIGTFHAFALNILKKYAHLLRVPFVSILDEEDKNKLIYGIIKRHGLDKRWTAKQVGYQISLLKNHLFNSSEFSHTLPDQRMFMELHQAYEQEKKQSKCLDFDDLLIEVLSLFDIPEFKLHFQQHIRHISVDEFQDTNIIQYALLKQMALHAQSFAIDSVAVVGDEDQSIYSWRGATVTNMLDFSKDFPSTQRITIAQNYRTVQPILEIANHLISHNTIRTNKTLWSSYPATNCIYLLSHASEYQEADAIAQFLKTRDYTKGQRSVALLYRAHFQSRALEEAFVKYSIPYSMVGGTAFYERKEIKDILAYARLVINPFDRTAFVRAINCPLRGLGDKFQEEVISWWNQEPFLNGLEVLSNYIKQKSINSQKRTAIEQFITLFNSVSSSTAARDVLEHIVASTQYIKYLQDNYDIQEATSRIENVKELLNATSTASSHDTLISLEQFIDQVSLMQEHTSITDQKNAVLLMTLHAAKGLEFDTVIIIGLEEGVIPSSRSLDQYEKLEEERRLLYVGITRAQKRLILSHARHRYTYGQMTDQAPSRFLQEIPPHLYHHYTELPQYAASQRTLFESWFANHTTIHPSFSSYTPSFLFSPVSEKKAAAVLSSATSPKKWYINQSVKHAQFGIGTIQKIEERSESYYLTIRFRTSTKKIAAQFIQSV